MKLRPWIPVLCAVPWVALFAAPQPQATAARVEFNHDVLPTLKAHCYQCHSGKQAQGGLLLDSREAILKGGVNGPLFEVGKGSTSLIIDRITGKGGKPRMPMGFAPLTDEQTKKIVAWIDQGADLPKAFTSKPHWAYLPPRPPSQPKVKNRSWVRNGIDGFILQKLEANGLTPSPEAPKAALLRRVSLDLVGLPPTPKQLDDFLKDTSPSAYQKVVERLLASPQYGERQARVWLDLARYADTDGYEKDLRRVAWPFRDWVIDAYNRNMPFDEFTIEQLAGDLLPKPTISQLVATGFHRNTMHNLEGGVDQDEARYQVMVDRVNTTSAVWMGSTMACSRCHDHKYDPFSQRDYFRMYAFFGNTAYEPQGNANVSEQKYYEPTVPYPTPEQVTKLRALDTEIARARTALKSAEAGFPAWRKRLEPVRWELGEPVSFAATGGVSLSRQPGGALLASGPNPAKTDYQVRLRLPAGTWRALRVEALADTSLPGRGPGRSGSGNFVLSGLFVSAAGQSVALQNSRATFEQSNQPVRATVKGPADQGWAVSPRFGEDHAAVFTFASPLVLATSTEVQLDLQCQSVYGQHNLGKFRVSFSASGDALVATLPTGATDEQLKQVYLADHPASQTLAALSDQKKALESEIGTAQILRERPTEGVPSAWVRHRGEFLGKTGLVSADVPSFLGRLRQGDPVNRLGLAKWLVDPQNPLTARVQVNRLWEQYFGRGIVETTEDLGTQSSKPTHPELLDWLALQFVQSKWDMKAMHRLIVTSATYRQSSNVSAKLMQKDPQNLLLSRGPRFRMEAEMIRDTALAISGLLSDKVGGPSVYPVQPEGTWDSPYSGERWMDSKGEDAHRRSIYTFWKRTAPYPKFMAFDATSREECTVRRLRTNTPLQALAMLNDAGTMEASRALAVRAKREAGKRDTLAYAFRLCTAREPNPAEHKRLYGLLENLRRHYQKNPKDAALVAKDPETAAMTMVANALLNLDETLNKG